MSFLSLIFVYSVWIQSRDVISGDVNAELREARERLIALQQSLEQSQRKATEFESRFGKSLPLSSSDR